MVKSYCIQVEVIQQPEDLILPCDFESFVGNKRYVSVKTLNLKSVERVEDLEVNSIQDCNIKNKRVIYHLKCKILTNTPELATEGIVKNMVLNTNDPNKNLKRQLKFLQIAQL